MGEVVQLRYYRCIASLVVFSTFLCMSSISISGDTISGAIAIGRITALHGPVTIKRPGQSEPVKSALGDDIAVGDVVRSEDGGRVQIALTDESFMNISGNASLRINQYSFAEKESVYLHSSAHKPTLPSFVVY